MKQKLFLFLLLQFSLSALVHAADYTLIDQLPAKLTAAKIEGHKGWDTGVTPVMKEASYHLNDVVLAGMIKSLGNTYYKRGFITDEEVDGFVKSLYAFHYFQQDIGNPSGESLGTMAGQLVAGDVSYSLENTIASMVQKITAGDPKFNYKAWRKKWDGVVNK